MGIEGEGEDRSGRKGREGGEDGQKKEEEKGEKDGRRYGWMDKKSGENLIPRLRLSSQVKVSSK